MSYTVRPGAGPHTSVDDSLKTSLREQSRWLDDVITVGGRSDFTIRACSMSMRSQRMSRGTLKLAHLEVNVCARVWTSPWLQWRLFFPIGSVQGVLVPNRS